MNRTISKSKNNRHYNEIWAPKKIKQLSVLLRKIYKNPHHYNKDDPLDELIFILLSSKTGEGNYLATYDSLKKKFPHWEEILNSPSNVVIKSIALGGLSKKKEKWIRETLREIKRKNGSANLSFLYRMKTKDAEKYLTSLPGIGLKSARCILMYSLDRKVFPVDSHCRRILSRLGIIEFKRLTNEVQDDIQQVVPSEIRFSLHVNLVAHGRFICRAINPLCSECNVRRLCKYYNLFRKDALT
jgi:endonuclease III